VNDMDALDDVCSAADSGGHLQAIAAEEIVFLKGAQPTAMPSPFYANTQTIVYMINTMSHLVNYTSGPCKNTVAIDVESSGGSFPGLPNYAAGTVGLGIPIREEATALRFLVPDLQTLVPDRMQPFYYQIGATVNPRSPSDCSVASPYVPCEVPYFFEETIVPQTPEVTVAPFVWNGSTASVGDACPTPTPGPATPPPDTGGAVDLVATCVPTDPDTGAAVFRQEYQHLYIDGNDYGPAAVLLNTASQTSVPIDSAWFSCSGCSPLSDFHFWLALSGGELTSVYYPGYAGGTIALPCTSTTYCTGNNTVLGNTTPYPGVIHPAIGPHSGVILLGSN
jgi:hypothetical protein